MVATEGVKVATSIQVSLSMHCFGVDSAGVFQAWHIHHVLDLFGLQLVDQAPARCLP